jgi:hypothetical protein
LKLADFRVSGAKETYAEHVWSAQPRTERCNIMQRPTQQAMIDALQPDGYDGWWSTHDRGDSTLEFCIFNPVDTVRITEGEMRGH